MPSFEDVTPTVLQSSVPREAPANMKNRKNRKKESTRNDTPLVVFRFSSCFLKSWRLPSPLSVNVTGAAAGERRRMANEDDHEPLL